MCIELKIKAKSLAAEAKIIRKEEQKLIEYIKGNKTHTNIRSISEDFSSIQNHRRNEVRFEARATALARAFIYNVAKTKVEPGAKPLPRYKLVQLTDKVAYMVGKYQKGKRYGSRHSNITYNKSKNRFEAVSELKEIVKQWLLS